MPSLAQEVKESHLLETLRVFKGNMDSYFLSSYAGICC